MRALIAQRVPRVRPAVSPGCAILNLVNAGLTELAANPLNFPDRIGERSARFRPPHPSSPNSRGWLDAQCCEAAD